MTLHVLAVSPIHMSHGVAQSYKLLISLKWTQEVAMTSTDKPDTFSLFLKEG